MPTLGQLWGNDKGITAKKRVGKRNSTEAKNNGKHSLSTYSMVSPVGGT